MTLASSVPVHSLLKSLAASSVPNNRAEMQRHSYTGLTEKQRRALTAAGHEPYQGKVRDVVPFASELLIVHSDRLTAFDRFLDLVPYKGTMLTALSNFWLRSAASVVPTHLLSMPHERVLRVRRMDPVKVEVVVRGYLAGSMMRAYAAGEREYCGVPLKDGLHAYGKLPTPIITPTTKAAAFEHDENATAAQLIKSGVVSASEWHQIEEMTMTLFAHGAKILAPHGWILVDTKYEFGRDEQGQIRVIDEVHTPDSSRYWVADSYHERVAQNEAPIMLDKENVRRYLLSVGFQGHGDVPAIPKELLLELAGTYLKVTETLTGQPLLSVGPEQEIDVMHLLG
jgi:phosphoribosylaminoimidazole-succinocarboxamide synthase